MRAALQIVLFVAGIAILALIAKGLTPVFPALGAILRGLLHPVAIVLIVGIVLLVRIGGSRRSPRGPAPPPTDPRG